MKKTILLILILALALTAGCKDFNNVKVTYEVYSNASDAGSIPDATVIYRDSDGTDHTVTANVKNGFQHSMSVPLGTHINLRATSVLTAPDTYSSIAAQVYVDDSLIAARLGNCSNGVALTYTAGDSTAYELICDFQGEARGVPQ